MAKNNGKQFEQVIREALERLPDVSVDRIHDQTTHFKGSTNVSDFVVYKKPYQYYFECKSVHGNLLSIYGKDPDHKYGNITNAQWEGMLEKSKINGVFAGVICWWVDKNVTRFIPIQMLQFLRDVCGMKSIKFDVVDVLDNSNNTIYTTTLINGVKRRVYFQYYMKEALYEISIRG